MDEGASNKEIKMIRGYFISIVIQIEDISITYLCVYISFSVSQLFLCVRFSNSRLFNYLSKGRQFELQWGPQKFWLQVAENDFSFNGSKPRN